MTTTRCPACQRPLSSSASGCRLRASDRPQSPQQSPQARICNEGHKGCGRHSVTQSHRDALAAITTFFHRDERSDDGHFEQVHDLLNGRSPAELREVSLAAAWFAAASLRVIESADAGLGAAMLEEFGHDLARASG